MKKLILILSILLMLIPSISSAIAVDCILTDPGSLCYCNGILPSNLQYLQYITAGNCFQGGAGSSGMINPMTTLGDMIYGGAAGTPTQLPGNTTTTQKFLSETGDGVNAGVPSWQTTNFVPYIGATANLDLGIHQLLIGNMGTEGGGVNIDGVNYDAELKVSDIGGTYPAELLLHKHSTTLQPIYGGVRSNTDDTTHANLINGQIALSVIGAGYAGSNYKLMGQIDIGADDTGTISNTSAPGKMVLSVTPDGSVTPVAAMTINNDGTIRGNFQLETFTSIVVQDSNYNAFPGITKLTNGNLFICYKTGAGHSTFGTIVSKVSTDGGVTWSTANTVYDSGNVNIGSSDPNVTMLSNGDLIVSFFTFHVDTGLSGIVYTTVSTDGGVTWNTPVTVGGFTLWGQVSAPVIQLVGGNLILPIYKQNIGDNASYSTSVLMQSTNGGASWTTLSTIANGQTATKDYEEPSVTLLANGHLLCSIRNVTTNKIAFTTSSDLGATWGSVVDNFFGISRFPMVQLANGIIVGAYRDYVGQPDSVFTNGRTTIRMSTDSGVTWTADQNQIHISLNAIYYYSEYAAMILFDPAHIGIVYAGQKDASTSAIYFQYIAMGNISLPPFVSGNFNGISNFGNEVIWGGLWFHGTLYGGSTIIMDAGSGYLTLTGYIATPKMYGNAAGTLPLDIQPNDSAFSVANYQLQLAHGTFTNTDAGFSSAVKITPVYNQTSGAESNYDLFINRTETAVGSGEQRLISAGTGGVSYTEKYGITTSGIVIAGGGSPSTVVCWKADGTHQGYATVAEITSGTCH